ncbi:YCII-related protein [Burkholderia sp. MR1]|nr:YCII-related protein [Burkholderia sp. MR1]
MGRSDRTDARSEARRPSADGSAENACLLCGCARFASHQCGTAEALEKFVFNDEELARLHGPVGIYIGSRTFSSVRCIELDRRTAMHCRASEWPIKTHVTDGPYTEWKEVVGGLFVIEADSLDDGLRIASMHPAATLGKEGGWAVELIPMDFYLARQGPRRLSRMGSRLHELLQGFVSRRGGVRSIPAGPCRATGPVDASAPFGRARRPRPFRETLRPFRRRPTLGASHLRGPTSHRATLRCVGEYL